MACGTRIGDRHVDSDTYASCCQHCLWHRPMNFLMGCQHCFPSSGVRLVSFLVKKWWTLFSSDIRCRVRCNNGFVIIVVGE